MGFSLPAPATWELGNVMRSRLLMKEWFTHPDTGIQEKKKNFFCELNVLIT